MVAVWCCDVVVQCSGSGLGSGVKQRRNDLIESRLAAVGREALQKQK